jgi:exo-1,4-beta-D-glucosaminidase
MRLSQCSLIVFISFLMLLSSNNIKAAVKQDPNITELKNNWFIYPSGKITVEDKAVSSPSFSTKEWYNTEVPKTVFAALVEKGLYGDPYFDMNMAKISKDDFKQPWWYRNEFTLDETGADINYQLTFEGINYKAELWVNEVKIASKEEFEGAFGIFTFNISKAVKKGKNVIAVKVFPPVKGDLTLGFVDWNPAPPDNNMGLWRGVNLKKTASVSMDHLFVRSKLDVNNFSEADLTVSASLTNFSNKRVKGIVTGEIEGKKFSKAFTLAASESKDITINTGDSQDLKIINPRVWWPNNLGKPELYNMKIKTLVDEKVSDKQSVRFGIRDVKDFRTEDDHRGFIINGKKIVIKGAGWVDDLMLNDSDEKVINQVKYARHMNLNTIRLEGFWGRNQTLYDAADENGILIMLGWSCQWEWEGYCGRKETNFMNIETPRDIEIQSKAYIDQVKWLRNHPGIFLWVLGSDKLPLPELETKMDNLLKENDPTRPVLSSSKGVTGGNLSKVTGNPGVKMLGPYDYVTPNYWYIDTTLGGAYGFNTETGPGPQVPPIESLKKMLPEKSLWPPDSVWTYHYGRNEFNNIKRFEKALDNRYGKPSTLDEFVTKSQMSNYEAMRPMFEAFGVNKFNSTGVIQWMYNSAWPEMYWQLFDWYMMPNGAFYGAMKGCQPLNPVFNYKDRDIYVVNDYNNGFDNLVAVVNILDNNSKVLLKKEVKFHIEENSSKKILDVPALEGANGLLFVNLEIKKEDGSSISDNFYWVSTKEDEQDFENSEWFVTPVKSYADMTQVNSLPAAKIDYSVNYKKEDNRTIAEVTVNNTSDNLAFFIELKLTDEKTGEIILPVFWSDNYVSLLPQSGKKLTAYFDNPSGNIKPVLKVNGWNAK